MLAQGPTSRQWKNCVVNLGFPALWCALLPPVVHTFEKDRQEGMVVQTWNGIGAVTAL